MKKFISAITAMMFLAVTITPLTSCGDDDDPTPDPDPTPETVKPKITIGNVESTETTITVTFTPDDKTVSYAYAIGSLTDESAFTAGTYTGIVKVTGKDVKEVEFENLEPGSNYAIFAQAESSDGTKSDLAKITATTKDKSTEPSVTLTIHSVHANRVSLTLEPNENCAYYIFDILDPFYYEYYDIENDYINYLENEGSEYEEEASGYVPYYPGYYEEEYYVFVLPYDANGNPGELIVEKVTTPAHNPETDLTITEIMLYSYDNTHARVLFQIPYENATGYYFALYTDGIKEASANELIDATLYATNKGYYDFEYDPEFYAGIRWSTPIETFLAQKIVLLVVPVDENNGYNGTATLLDFTEAVNNMSARIPMKNTQAIGRVDYADMTINTLATNIVKSKPIQKKFVRTK